MNPEQIWLDNELVLSFRAPMWYMKSHFNRLITFKDIVYKKVKPPNITHFHN